MVKTKTKKKVEEKSESSSFNFAKIRRYAFPILALLVAVIGFKIRYQTASYKYFIDPDTFYHFEIYKLTIKEWIPKYYMMADAPFGAKIAEPLGLYILPAILYKILSVFGYSEIAVFKLWPPLVGFFSIIAIYLLGKKFHSDWAGLWAAAVMMFSTAHFVRTFSGNNRGDGPFLMLFLYAVLSLFIYLETKDKKKYIWGALFIVLSVVSLSVWNGSPFGLMVFLGFASVYAILLFIFGKIENLKEFIRDFYPAYFAVLVLGYLLTFPDIIQVRSFIRFAFEVFVALVVLTLIMLYGEKFKLNYSDKKHRFAVVAMIILIGFAGAYAYVGPKLFKLMSGAYQSTQVYETVQELAKTTWSDVSKYYAVKSSDGIIFLLSLLGIATVLFRFLNSLFKNGEVSEKQLFVLIYYAMSLYLMWTAVRFLFLASGAVILVFGILIGELFSFVENMKEKASTKALYAVLLIILFIPIPIAGATTMNSQAKAMAKAGSVTPSWEEVLKWLNQNTPKLSTATSWWDYGYWIESSLLGNRRSPADGGHARDRDYILARFLANDGTKSEVDFESWELNYFIVWTYDYAKFNAISYLGGAISRKERDNLAMILPFQKYGDNLYALSQNQLIRVLEENGKKRVVIQIGNQQLEPIQTIFVQTGEVIKGQGTYPGVVWIFPNYAILTYQKVAFSNFFRMAFLGGNGVPNFQLVKSTGDINVYEFHPFIVYRIDIYKNGTWTPIQKLEPGEYKAKLYISAFGRDVKDATIKLRAYKDGKLIADETIATNVNIDHLNEKPIEVTLSVPNATKYELVLIQKGPVGVLADIPTLNGEPVKPTYVVKEGQSGKLKLTAEFDKDYTVSLYLRATIIYLVRTQGTSNEDENAAFEPHMDIIKYVPVKEGISVKAGVNTITADVEMPQVFAQYIEQLKQKYGADKVIVRGKRIEPVFIADKEYVIYKQG
ncbi:peptide transporter [Thermococcus sp. M39]|uniref:STT3 domain-containing protein n=1 Tax=unclassified Thermococcus TaxID=2627626 RepID=UPI00143AA0DB|nr:MULTISPECIES: STT3 domain-containing protein [unclassified Thermococcus]NJE08731.1 peptide transporter [Thermococcus sp. M39]NJE12968.1 peptide transporter [Thermococcus sp. LS2]